MIQYSLKGISEFHHSSFEQNSILKLKQKVKFTCKVGKVIWENCKQHSFEHKVIRNSTL